MCLLAAGFSLTIFLFQSQPLPDPAVIGGCSAVLAGWRLMRARIEPALPFFSGVLAATMVHPTAQASPLAEALTAYDAGDLKAAARGFKADKAVRRLTGLDGPWDGDAAAYQRRHARQLNRFDEPRWGVWGIPESTVGAVGDVAGLDVLEDGCGAGQWSIALARRGARVVGIDL